MTFEIKNRVSESKLITIDFNDFITDFSFENFDIKPWLKDGLVLIEKDFREKVKGFDWTSPVSYTHLTLPTKLEV